MSRRPLSTFLGVASLGLAAALLPATAATAAPSDPFTMAIAPDHGVPGTALTATITTPDCAEGTVTVTGSYIDIDGEQATTSPVVATKNSATDWTAALSVPADAARSSLSEEPVTFTATTTCAVQAPSSQTVTDEVTIDDLAAATVRVSPLTVEAGNGFSFSISGCTGGIAALFFLDNEGTDTDVDEADVTGDGPSYRGTFTVPADAAEGEGELVVLCTQAGDGAASLTIAAAAVAPPAAVPPAAPVAAPVDATPSFTG